MSSTQYRARTTGSVGFEPDSFLEKWTASKPLPEQDNLRASITKAFDLPSNDHYVYHAVASVTLSQVQEAIRVGSEHGLHAWYLDDNGESVK